MAVSWVVGHRHGWDPALLWLWCRPATVAPILPLAWECPCAVSAALKSQKKKTEERKKRKVRGLWVSLAKVKVRDKILLFSIGGNAESPGPVRFPAQTQGLLRPQHLNRSRSIPPALCLLQLVSS